MLSAVGRFYERGGGGGGGVLSAVGRFYERDGGGGGGGGVLSAVGRFYERGGEGGAVRCRPIQLVCAVRFNKWEVRMKARGANCRRHCTSLNHRGGQQQTSLYKLKSQGGPSPLQPPPSSATECVCTRLREF